MTADLAQFARDLDEQEATRRKAWAQARANAEAAHRIEFLERVALAVLPTLIREADEDQLAPDVALNAWLFADAMLAERDARTQST